MTAPQNLCAAVVANKSNLPCLASIWVLAGLHASCEVCSPHVAAVRSRFGWACQLWTDYYLSDQITAQQRKMLLRQIRIDLKHGRASKKTLPPALAASVEGKQPGDLRAELHHIQGLILAAQSTLSVDDFGDNLAGAQQRIQALIDQIEQGRVGA